MTEPRQAASPTFREFADRWLVDYYAPLRPRYLLRNRSVIVKKYLIPSIGEQTPLGAISTSTLQFAQRRLLAQGLALSTVRSSFGVFASIWQAARGEGLVLGRPHSDVVWPRVRRKRPVIFLPEERDAIVDAFRRHRPAFLPQIAICAFAGTRPSEAAGLRWRDLNPRTGRLDITEPLVNREPTQGKTRKSLRQIVLVPQLCELLNAHRGNAEDDELMSRYESGGAVDTERFSPDILKPICLALGIRYRGVYAMRRGFITVELMDGRSAAVVASYCGTSIKEIEDSYLSWIGAVELGGRNKREPAFMGLADLRRETHRMRG